jgi:hypothetical protein
MAPPDANGPDGSQLRERLPQNPEKSKQTTSTESAKQAVADLNAAEAKREDGREKRTYGRTPDGTGTLEYMPLCQATCSSIGNQLHPKQLLETSKRALYANMTVPSIQRSLHLRHGVTAFVSYSTQKYLGPRNPPRIGPPHPHYVYPPIKPSHTSIRSTVLVLERVLQCWDRIPFANTISGQEIGCMG